MLAFLLSLTLHAHAARPVQLSPGAFQLHVRPQLVGIHQDFRQLLATFPEYPAEVLSLMDGMTQTEEASRRLRQSCPGRLVKSCLEGVDALRSTLRNLELPYLRLQARLAFPASAGISPLAGLRAWMELEEGRTRLLHLLDLQALELAAGRSGSATDDIIKRADELQARHDILVAEFIPPRYQQDFRSAWMNFFRPLQRHGEQAGDHRFVTTNLEQLNFYWNLLNMRMTKRLKSVPPGMGPPLNAIQNRWNQVMRICYGM